MIEEQQATMQAMAFRILMKEKFDFYRELYDRFDLPMDENTTRSRPPFHWSREKTYILICKRNMDYNSSSDDITVLPIDGARTHEMKISDFVDAYTSHRGSALHSLHFMVPSTRNITPGSLINSILFGFINGDIHTSPVGYTFLLHT